MFEGPFDDKYKQIGNAVPPLVATRMGEHIVSVLQGKTIADSGVVNGYERDVLSQVGRGFAVTINGIKRRRKAQDTNIKSETREIA